MNPAVVPSLYLGLLFHYFTLFKFRLEKALLLSVAEVVWVKNTFIAL